MTMWTNSSKIMIFTGSIKGKKKLHLTKMRKSLKKRRNRCRLKLKILRMFIMRDLANDLRGLVLHKNDKTELFWQGIMTQNKVKF
jgi:hypothetical protein